MKGTPRELEYAKHQDVGVDHDEGAAQRPGKRQQVGYQQHGHDNLGVGHAGVFQPEVPVAANQQQEHQLGADAKQDMAEHQPG